MAMMAKAMWRAGVLAFVLGSSVTLAVSLAKSPARDAGDTENVTRPAGLSPVGALGLANLSRQKTTRDDGLAFTLLAANPLPIEVGRGNFVRESDLRSGFNGGPLIPSPRAPPFR
jgi:hypothetical protein